MLGMIGRFIAVIGLVLFPPQKLKLTYFIFVIVETISTIILLGMHIFPKHYELLFCIGMIGLGIGRGIYTFPYLLLYENYEKLDEDDEERKKNSKMLINIWFGMILLGHAIAIPLTRWFLEDFGLHWTVSMLIFALIYLLTGVLVCAFIPEQLIRREEEEDEKLAQKLCKIF